MAVEVRDNRESPRVKTIWVLTFVGGFVLLVALAMFGLHRFYRGILTSEQVRESFGTFPIPQIQPNPTQDLQEFRRRQNEQLAGYAWVDKDRGLVHVPVEQAMALVVSRGKSALDAPGQTPAALNGVGTGTPPDGAPRAPASMRASPYGAPQ